MTLTHPHDDRGGASVFVVGMAVILVVMAGLVADGGGALNAKMRLADDLEHAAIAGAQATDEERLRATGELVIDEAEAAQRIRDHLAGKGYEAITYRFEPAGAPTTVTVNARQVVKTKTLLLIGWDEFLIEAEATAGTDVLP